MSDTSAAKALSAPRLLLAVAVLVGIGLRAWQYFSGTSLWLDELAIANSLLDRGFGHLATQPMDFHQVAPIGFVLLEKSLTLLFGDSEAILRLWSFLTGIGSVVAAAALAKEAVGERDAWVPTLILALSTPLILQSAQVKPYSGDILITELIVLYALRAHRRPEARIVGPALLGALAPWFSLPSVFVLAGASVALLLSARESSSPATWARATRRLVIVWGASCVLALAVASSRVTAEVTMFMKGYWAGGFPPMPPRSLHDLAWPVNTLATMFWEFAAYRAVRPLALLVLLGAVVIVVRRRGPGLSLALPLVAAFGAAAFQLYPLEGRVAFWLAPLLFLLLVIGARFVLDLIFRRLDARLPAILLAGLTWFPIRAAAARPIPVRIQDAKPVLRQVVASAAPDDALYVYYGAWQAYHYYGNRLGLDRLSVTIGSCARDDRQLPLRELEALLDHDRIWILVSHADATLRELEMIVDGMERLGARRLDSYSAPTPPDRGTRSVIAMLYDLRDARRRRDSGVRVPLAPDDASVPRPGCWRPMIPDSLDRTGIPKR